MFKNILLIFALFFSLPLLAQNEETPDFNSVKPVCVSDFSTPSPLLTPETEAVILVDSGSSKLDANLDDGFFMKYYKFSRMLVLKKSVMDIRLTLKGKTEESLFNENTQTVPLRKSLDSFSCSHLKDLDELLSLYYKMTLDPGKQSHLYFNPLLNLGLTENPFKSAQRLYPVEMPYVLDKTYETDMGIPPCYAIEKLPKSEKFLLNDSEASYEYIISLSGNKIHLKSSLVFTKSIFEPEDYGQIRDFYAGMIKNQNELFVFRKK